MNNEDSTAQNILWDIRRSITFTDALFRAMIAVDGRKITSREALAALQEAEANVAARQQ